MKTQKIALITGAAKGLGNAIALHLAKNNYIVVLHYFHSQKEAEKTQQIIQDQGGKAMVYKANIDSKTEIEQMFEFIEQTFGKLDVLVNNIGNYLKKNILEVTYEQWNDIVHNNVTSAFYTSKLAINLMKKNSFGRIINLGFASIGQIKAEPLITPYFIAKTGVLLLTKAMAKEVIKDGITMHVISPGVLENSVTKPILEIPKGTLGTFKDICNVLDLLISEENSYLTGTHIEVAGGWRL